MTNKTTTPSPLLVVGLDRKVGRTLSPPKNKRRFMPRCCGTCKLAEAIKRIDGCGETHSELKCRRDGEYLDDSLNYTVPLERKVIPLTNNGE